MIDVLTVGRVSVDLYAEEPGVGFDGQQHFRKSVGGSPTNVAVAAARLGLHAAVATKVGGDGFGDYVRGRLADWGVDTTYVGTEVGALTPLALAALDPPENPQIAFYRLQAPDTRLTASDVPAEVVRDCRLLWISFGALSGGTTAEAARTWLDQRDRRRHTVLDLDYRPTMWPDRDIARAEAIRAIDRSTVVVGNREECEVAVGETDPDRAADRLLERGVTLAIVKMGGDGVLLATTAGRTRVAPHPIELVCGLGAGDAFGGALCLGLLEGWELERLGRFANAAGAIVASRLTCADAMPSADEVRALTGGDDA